MPDISDKGKEAANHIAMYEPMQQSCIFFTCTPEPKMQLYVCVCVCVCVYKIMENMKKYKKQNNQLRYIGSHL